MPAEANTSSRRSAAGEAPCIFDATIALGSNIGDRVANIEEAIARLTADEAVKLLARSRLYRTSPWGVTDQDWFVNACIRIRTALSPRALLLHCQSVENAMGRVRTKRWGPRIIDVDILTYADLTVNEPDLRIPHPLIAERAFVLVPLKDVAPEIRIDGASLDTLLSRLDAADVQPLEL
jgi:2-amino-4-hydroxy-6-hydroxymethyldihydropteridine diphosphokinase